MNRLSSRWASWSRARVAILVRDGMDPAAAKRVGRIEAEGRAYLAKKLGLPVAEAVTMLVRFSCGGAKVLALLDQKEPPPSAPGLLFRKATVVDAIKATSTLRLTSLNEEC